jgi:hypothetical protein
MTTNEDIRNCGLTPVLLQAVARRQGAEGLRRVISGVRKLAVMQLHPDALGGKTDAVFMKLTEATEALLNESDVFLVDLVRNYRGGKTEVEPVNGGGLPSYRQGSILQGVMEGCHQYGGHLFGLRATISLRPFITDGTIAVQSDASTLLGMKEMRQRYAKLRNEASRETAATKKAIKAVEERRRDARRKISAHKERIKQLESNIVQENEIIKKLVKGSSISDHKRQRENYQKWLAEAIARLPEVVAENERVIASAEVENGRLEAQLRLETGREQAVLADLTAQCAEEERELRARAAELRGAVKQASGAYLVELTDVGIRYRRADDEIWQVEDGLFFLGSLDWAVVESLRKSGVIRTSKAGYI